jgi:predicted DNA-binding protein
MSKTMVSARIPEQLGQDLEALAEATRRSKAFLVTKRSTTMSSGGLGW